MITYEEIVQISGVVIATVLVSIHIIKKIICPKKD
jgi:hypothetical protein